MKNLDVIEKFIFLQGKEKSKTQHLYIDTENKQLINYNTVIAQWNGTEEQTKEIEINCNKYSTTTSKIQTQIYNTLKRAKQFYNFIIVLNGNEKEVAKVTKILNEN
mgnify:CR=1 FL=1